MCSGQVWQTDAPGRCTPGAGLDSALGRYPPRAYFPCILYIDRRLFMKLNELSPSEVFSYLKNMLYSAWFWEYKDDCGLLSGVC